MFGAVFIIANIKTFYAFECNLNVELINRLIF